MRKYHQLTSGERYALSTLRRQGYTQGAMARALGRHPSTISRELSRTAARQAANAPRMPLLCGIEKARRTRLRVRVGLPGFGHDRRRPVRLRGEHPSSRSSIRVELHWLGSHALDGLPTSLVALLRAPSIVVDNTPA